MKEKNLFAPPTQAWQCVSPKYVYLCFLKAALAWLIPLTIVLVIGIFIPQIPRLVCYIVWAFFIFMALWRIPWQYFLARAWGYAERESDLYIKSGLLWRHLVVVPYGRMQAVELHAGPVHRILGLASIELVTASASSNAIIPGLDMEQAELLRDRLTELGEDQAAGL